MSLLTARRRGDLLMRGRFIAARIGVYEEELVKARLATGSRRDLLAGIRERLALDGPPAA